MSPTIGADPPPIVAAERAGLLSLARGAVAAHLAGDQPPPAPAACPAGERPAAAFVTVRGPGRVVRGCIGRLTADRPLADVVATMAVAAATQDPRFSPVTPSELAELKFEISVLSPLRAATPDQVVVGRDGVIVQRRGGGRQGVLLPAVAAEYGWDAPTLLTAACRKAGLPPGAWQDRRETELYVFETEVFGEEE